MNRSENLAEQFAALGPWTYQFQIGGEIYGGGISAEGDVRVERFLRYVRYDTQSDEQSATYPSTEIGRAHV